MEESILWRKAYQTPRTGVERQGREIMRMEGILHTEEKRSGFMSPMRRNHGDSISIYGRDVAYGRETRRLPAHGGASYPVCASGGEMRRSSGSGDKILRPKAIRKAGAKKIMRMRSQYCYCTLPMPARIFVKFELFRIFSMVIKRLRAFVTTFVSRLSTGSAGELSIIR